jgi:uncharacterized protein
MRVFLDTNCVLKLYHAEPGTDAITDFFMRYQSQLSVAISELTTVEMQSAVMRRVRMREMSIQTAREIVSVFTTDISSMLVVPLSTPICVEAARLVEENGAKDGLKTLDSLHIASAMVLQRSLPIDWVFSSDRTFVTIMRRSIPTLNPVTDVLP